MTAVDPIPPIPYARPAPAGALPPQAFPATAHAIPVAPGLTPEHLSQLSEARRRAAKIRRGVSVATFNGWATGIFGALTFIGGFMHWIGFLLGAAMLVVAFVEFRGAERLRQLEPYAPQLLAWNQVFFGIALLLYASYSLWAVMHHRGALATELQSMGKLPGIAMDIQRLERSIGLLVYGTLAAVAVFGQGGTALFYLSRRKHVESYRRKTPQWILDAQRAGMPM